MSELQKETAFHVDMKKGVWLHGYRLPNEYLGLSEEFDYRLEINGYEFPITEEQFDAMHQARIQVWDDGAKAEQERIIKLLENPYYHHTFLGPRDVNDEPAILHDGECIGCMAISKIKGEQK